MTLIEAVEQAEKASEQFEVLARMFLAAGIQLQEALSQVSALMVIEKAKESDAP